MNAELKAIARQAANAELWFPLAGCVDRLTEYIAKQDERIAKEEEATAFFSGWQMGHDARHTELEARLEKLEGIVQAQKRQWESLQRDTHGRLLVREACFGSPN